MIHHALPFASHKVKCHLYKLLLPFRPSGQHLTHFPSDQGYAEAVTPQQPSALCQLLLPNCTRTLWKLWDAWGSMEIEPKQAFCPPCCMVRTLFLLCPRTAFFVGTCGIADCTGWFPAAPPWSTHFSQSQGPKASLYLQEQIEGPWITTLQRCHSYPLCLCSMFERI